MDIELNIFMFLIVCPLVGLAGFVDAVAGGGGLISLPAYMLIGIPPAYAIGTNKVSSAMGTSIATYRYARMGYIKPKLCISAVIFALLGSWLGAELTLAMSDEFLKIFMLIALPLLAIYVIRKKSFSGDKEPYKLSVTIILTSVISLFMGVYDGFYGPGTGTFLMLMLTGIAHYSLDDATGTTKVINLSTNIAALVTFLLNGVIILPLGLAAGVFNIIGAYLGTKMYKSKGINIARPLIIVVICIFFVKIILEMLGIL